MPTWSKIVIAVLAVILIGVGGYAIYKASQNEEVAPVQNNLPEEETNKIEEQPKKEEEHKISKYAQMYITLLEDLMPADSALNEGDFISIDAASLDKEYANEELKETTQVFFIDDADIKDIVDYMKKWHETIKTNSMEELKEQGLMHTEDNFPYCDGAIVSVTDIKILGEDHFEISMQKYRSGLAAIFNTYDVKYEDGAWKYEIIRAAIS